MNSTSTSDNGSYPLVCRAAASEDSIFDNFKLYPQYRQILEHVSFEQGTKYYDEFKDIENLVSILDKIGHPKKVEHEGEIMVECDLEAYQ